MEEIDDVDAVFVIFMCVYQCRWLGLVGQFRPKKLISDIKREFLNSDEFDLTLLKEAASHFLDKSLYSVSLCSQLSLEPLPSLLWSTEKHGHNKETRNKFMLYKKVILLI